LARSWTLVHVLDITVAAAAACLLFQIARRLLNPAGAIAAAIWYLVLYAGGGFLGLAQAESWSNLPACGALLLLCKFREGENWRRTDWFWLGLLTGLVTSFKPTSVLVILPAMGIAVWQRREPRSKTGSARLSPAISGIAITIGFSLPPILFAGWLWKHGALDTYTEIQRGYVAPYVKTASASFIETLTFFLIHICLLIGASWLPTTLCGIGLLNRDIWRPGSKLFTVVAGAGGFLAVWVQNRAFGYHWQVMLPALAIMAAAGSVALTAPLTSRRTWFIPMLVPLGWHLATMGYLYLDAPRYLAGDLDELHWVQRLTKFRESNCANSVNPAVYVRQHSAPDDRFLVWGFANELNVLSNRRSSTHYFLSAGLISPFAPQHWRTEFLEQLQAEPPKFLAIVKDDDNAWLGVKRRPGDKDTSSFTLMQNWPEFKRIVDQHYHLELSNPHVNLYRLTDPEGGTRS
jgi:hypothetical protein